MVVELVKVLAWPVFAICVFLSLWSPLRRTADMIPSIIGSSEAITIAGLSLKVGHSLRSKATPEVMAVLSEISTSGLKRIMEMEASQYQYWNQNDAEDARNLYRELIKLGLVREVPESSLAELKKSNGKTVVYALELTQLGEETQKFLESIVRDFAQDLARQAELESH
jgi:hypothetical protein